MVFPPPHLRRFRRQTGQIGQIGRVGGSPVLLWYFMCKMALYVCFGYRARSFCLFWIPSSAILRPGAPPRPGDPWGISGGSPGPLILRITIGNSLRLTCRRSEFRVVILRIRDPGQVPQVPRPLLILRITIGNSLRLTCCRSEFYIKIMRIRDPGQVPGTLPGHAPDILASETYRFLNKK